MHDVRILDRDGQYANTSLSVQVERTPENLLFKGREIVELKAHICADCGYAELYAVAPDKLWQARAGG